jgi:hypothetical protein
MYRITPILVCRNTYTHVVEEDQQKLLRLLGYLQAMVSKKLLLRPEGVLKVEAYVDAAFAIHRDSKSHTRVAVFVGRALVNAVSRKQ